MRSVRTLILMMIPIAVLIVLNASIPCDSLFQDFLPDGVNIIVIATGTAVMLILSGNIKAFFNGFRIVLTVRDLCRNDEIEASRKAVKYSIIYALLLSCVVEAYQFTEGIISCFEYIGRMSEYTLMDGGIVSRVLMVFIVNSADFMCVFLVILTLFPMYIELKDLISK